MSHSLHRSWTLLLALLAPAALPGLAAAQPAAEPGEQPGDGASHESGDESGPALLERAQVGLDALRYEESAALLDRAWRAGGNRPDDLARLFRLTGSVAVTLGRDRDADLAFRRLLALDPDAALPDGTSPKIAARLQEARAALAGEALRAEVAARGTSGQARVAIDVASDPTSMVAAVRARYRDRTGAEKVRVARGGLAVALPGLGAPRVVVEVLDEHGNVLVERSLDIRVAPAPRPPPGVRSLAPVAPEPEPAPFYARSLPWAVTAAGIGAVGVFFGVRSYQGQKELDRLNRNSIEHDFHDAIAVEDRLRRDSAIANVTFAATGVAAIAAAYFWFRERRRAPRDQATSAAPAASFPAAWTIHF
jgi:hypothetical protein